MNVRVLLAVVFSIAALTTVALAQEEFVLSPAANRELREGERFCGNYFVVRERGGERRLVFRLSTTRTRTTLWMSFPISRIVTVVEGTETAPVARMVFGKKGIREIWVRLSRAHYETARDCLPAPRTKK